MDKLSPNMISLDPDVVATIETSDAHMKRDRLEQLQQDKEAAAAAGDKKKQKSKKRGRSKIQTQLRRKARNVVDEGTIKLREARDAEVRAKEESASTLSLAQQHKGKDMTVPPGRGASIQAPAALQRFYPSL